MREKLGNLYKISSGGTPLKSIKEYYEDGTIKWVKTGDLKHQYLYNTEDCITEAGLNKSSAKIYEKNTVLVAMYGATIGATSILKISACTNQACAAFPPIDRVISEYLYYFLKSKKSQFVKDGVGGAQPNISGSYLKKVEFTLFELNIQKKIVDILDNVNKVISYRKQQIEQLDNLIKSRFVEMFGVLDTNEKNFDIAPLKELCNKITDGKHGGCESVMGTGYYFVGAREIYDGIVHYDNAPEIASLEFEKDYKRCNIEKGDFLIVNTGATIGKSAIALDERTENTLLQKSVALIKTKKDVLVPIFLQYCYMVNPKLYLVESSSAQPNLLLSKIKDTAIYVPTIDLQNQFTTFVQQVDKLKAEVQKSLDETEILFNSLMQDYFK